MLHKTNINVYNTKNYTSFISGLPAWERKTIKTSNREILPQNFWALLEIQTLIYLIYWKWIKAFIVPSNPVISPPPGPSTNYSSLNSSNYKAPLSIRLWQQAKHHFSCSSGQHHSATTWKPSFISVWQPCRHVKFWCWWECHSKNMATFEPPSVPYKRQHHHFRYLK
jgi:hypothetical protein